MIISLLISLFFSSAAQANAIPAVCSNLATVTCKEGIRDDGTGLSYVSNAEQFRAQEFSRMEPSTRAAFDEMLNNEEGDEFKVLVKQACRLEKEPACKRASARSCHNPLVNCLSMIYRFTEIDPEHRYMNERTHILDAEKALDVVRDEFYKNAAKKIAEQNRVEIRADVKNRVAKEIFPNVKIALLQKIKDLPVDETTRSILVKKISTITFAGFECPTEVDYSTGIGQTLKPNAMYNPSNNSFEICPGYLRSSSSEFDLASMIAHELAHAIDPCRLGLGNMNVKPKSEASPDRVIDDQYLRANFLKCLRSPRSIEAKSFRKNEPPIPGSSEVALESLRRFCSLEDGGIDEEVDQINESVSDWFAAESLANYLTNRNLTKKPALTTAQMQIGMSNVLRPICGTTESRAETELEHPPTSERINSIYAVHPKLRSMMGCPAVASSKRYCDINNPASLTGGAVSKPASTVTPKATR